MESVELGEDVAEGPARVGVERLGAPQLHARKRPAREGEQRRRVSLDEHQLRWMGARNNIANILVQKLPIGQYGIFNIYNSVLTTI